jgi:tetratricopeptide (TPR) repeat protein
MRKHGLIAADENAKSERGAKQKRDPATASFWKKNRLIIAIASAVIVLGVGALFWWLWPASEHKTEPLDQPGLGALPAARLQKALKAHGLSNIPLPFAKNEAIERWASGAKKTTPQKTAQALLDKLTKIKKPNGALRVISPQRLDTARLLTATEILERQNAAVEVKIPSYSLACLTLASARAIGAKAVLVEIHRVSDRKGPADPTGSRGRFGVALFAKSYDQPEPDVVIDPMSGKLDTAAEVELLDDQTALAHYLNHRAQRMLSSGPDSSVAMMLSGAAAQMARNSATIRCGRGLVMLAVGGIQPALSSFQAAIALRDDAPRHYCMAQALLAMRKIRKALSHLKTAIKKNPAYGQAYVEQARLMLGVGQAARAEELLDRAAQTTPDLWDIKVLRAMLHAAKGDVATAVTKLETLIAQRPQDLQTFFALWQILMGTNQEKRAAKLEKQILSGLKGAKREMLAARLKQAHKAFAELKARAATQGGAGPGGALSGNAPPAGGPPPSAGGPPAGGAPGGGTLPSPDTPAPDMDFKLKTPTPGSMTPSKTPADRYKLNY